MRNKSAKVTLRNGGRTVAVAVSDQGGGAYEGRYTLPEAAADETWQLSVTLHGCPVGRGPVAVQARAAWGVRRARPTQGWPPMVTMLRLAAGPKLVPVMVTVAPARVGRFEGLTAVTLGAS